MKQESQIISMVCQILIMKGEMLEEERYIFEDGIIKKVKEK